MNTIGSRLNTALVAAVGSPLSSVVNGMSMSNEQDKSTWVMHFDLSATDAQKAAVNAVIAAFDPSAVSTNPVDYPLTMRQLRQALLTFGGQPVDFVASVVAKIADPNQKALATIWYEETTTGINWGDPETQFLIAASGIPLAQASALWLKAKDL